MARSTESVVVHKFGGAALADAEAIRHAAQIVAARPAGAVVVASAMQGVTDALLDLAVVASRDDRRGMRVSIDALRERHLAAAGELSPDGGEHSAAEAID